MVVALVIGSSAVDDQMRFATVARCDFLKLGKLVRKDCEPVNVRASNVVTESLQLLAV